MFALFLVFFVDFCKGVIIDYTAHLVYYLSIKEVLPESRLTLGYRLQRSNCEPGARGGYFFFRSLPKMYPSWNTVIENDNNEMFALFFVFFVDFCKGVIIDYTVHLVYYLSIKEVLPESRLTLGLSY